MKLAHLWRTLLLISLLGGCEPVAAQEGTAEGTAASSTADAAPRVLRPAEVVAAAQQATATVQRVRARVHHVRDLEHHLAEIDTLGAEVARLRTDSDLETLETEPVRELRNLEEQWATLDVRLADTSEALETSAGELGEQAEVVEGVRLRWAATAEAATGESYGPAARQRIDEVLALVDEVSLEIRANLEQVLAAQTRLAGHSLITGDVLAALDRAVEESQARVLSRTHPLGFGGATERAPTPLSRQLQRALTHHLHGLDRFATHVGSRGYVHGVVVFALLAFLFWLRRDQRLDADHPAASTLQRPIALALFAGLLLVRAIHPLVPRAVVELSQLLAAGPLLTLEMPLRVRRATRMVALLYGLDWIRLLFDEHDAEHRVALLATAVLAAGGLGACARAADGAARAIWGVASAGAAVGAGACLAGYVPLAGVLVEGVVASAYVAMALLALKTAALGWIDAALSTPL